MALTFSLSRGGLEIDVLVNRDVAVLMTLWQAGSRPPPLSGRGLIDTGNDITGISSSILSRLGLQPVRQITTHGIGGSVTGDLYRVSLSILDAQATTLPWIVYPVLDVMELPTTIPFDALRGLDVIRTCKMCVDGPGAQFTLDR
jgi:hypothetical protein